MRVAYASSHRSADHTATDGCRDNRRCGDGDARAYVNVDIYTFAAHSDTFTYRHRHALTDPVANFYADGSADRYRNRHTDRDADTNAGIRPHPDWGLA